MRSLWLALLFVSMLAAPSWAELRGETVLYKQGDAVLEGYAAWDDSFTGPRPGVLVVHEWKGLNDFARRQADRLAQMGYVAFAADIYGKGVRPADTKDAAAESSKYKDDRPLLRARAQAGLEALKARPGVDPQRLAAVGYCFGGTTVLELARSGAELKAAVSFHGGLATPTPLDARNIRAELLVLHGAADPYVPPEEVAAFEKEMAEGGVKYKLVSYPGAVHGFTNPANTGEVPGALYDAKADSQSWMEMKEFFRRAL